MKILIESELEKEWDKNICQLGSIFLSFGNLLAFYVEFGIINIIIKNDPGRGGGMEKVLNDAVDIIVKNFAPDKIILFGSRAIGMAAQDSDYDLCVLKSSLQHKRKTAQDIYRALVGLEFAVDLIVETPENFGEWKTNPFLIYGKIAEQGKVLYEKQ